jgi:hypothetical protein
MGTVVDSISWLTFLVLVITVGTVGPRLSLHAAMSAVLQLGFLFFVCLSLSVANLLQCYGSPSFSSSDVYFFCYFLVVVVVVL